MSGKASIPVLNSSDYAVNRFASAVKQSLDGITGQQKNAIQLAPLPTTATTTQIIAQLNAMLTRMQG